MPDADHTTRLAPELPALPEPDIFGTCYHEELKICYIGKKNFSADLMRAYAEESRLPLLAEIERLEADNDRKNDALEKIASWAKAYPLSVFPEPDFAKAHEVLTTAGMTLDAISASNMRYVITQVQKIVADAIAQQATQGEKT